MGKKSKDQIMSESIASPISVIEVETFKNPEAIKQACALLTRSGIQYKKEKDGTKTKLLVSQKSRTMAVLLIQKAIKNKQIK